jgi:hypothetical protein
MIEYNHMLLACILLPTMGGIIASQAQNTFSTFGLFSQLSAVLVRLSFMVYLALLIVSG